MRSKGQHSQVSVCFPCSEECIAEAFASWHMSSTDQTSLVWDKGLLLKCGVGSLQLFSKAVHLRYLVRSESLGRFLWGCTLDPAWNWPVPVFGSKSQELPPQLVQFRLLQWQWSRSAPSFSILGMRLFVCDCASGPTCFQFSCLSASEPWFLIWELKGLKSFVLDIVNAGSYKYCEWLHFRPRSYLSGDFPRTWISFRTLTASSGCRT